MWQKNRTLFSRIVYHIFSCLLLLYSWTFLKNRDTLSSLFISSLQNMSNLELPLTILTNLISAAIILFVSAFHRIHDAAPYSRIGDVTMEELFNLCYLLYFLLFLNRPIDGSKFILFVLHNSAYIPQTAEAYIANNSRLRPAIINYHRMSLFWFSVQKFSYHTPGSFVPSLW